MPDHTLDLEHLLKLRVVVARIGEMDIAQWWNTKGQLGALGAATLRRGLPRTHYFAQARSVFAVAAQRCDEVFNPPGCVTLWRLPEEVEERFDARWEHWLDNTSDWEPFFRGVADLRASDLLAALGTFDLVSEPARAAFENLPPAGDGRSVQLPDLYGGTGEDVTLLALGFARASVGSLLVPYARLGDV
jgi:hypothetical protein